MTEDILQENNNSVLVIAETEKKAGRPKGSKSEKKLKRGRGRPKKIEGKPKRKPGRPPRFKLSAVKSVSEKKAKKEKKEIVKDRKQLTIYIPDELYRVIKVIVTLRKTNISREVKLFLEGFARENKPLIYKMFPQKKQNKIDGR